MRFLAFIIFIALSVKTFDCAEKSRSLERIVRGHETVIDRFPYVVRMHLQRGTKAYLCGAALIGKRWLLTAAHCVYETISVEVYLGYTHNRAQRTYKVPLSDITIHPSYSEATEINDIALVKIPRTELSRNQHIGFVPLPKLSNANCRYGEAYAIVSGWGMTSTNGNYSSSLQYGRLQILKKQHCLRMPVRHVRKNIRNVICTAVRSDLASICAGDSGGPLVLERTGELIGIASLADTDNCENGNIAVFTRVARYVDWIECVSGISY